MTITRTRPRGVGRKLAHDPGDPLVTSHCPFCGSGQVVGRSDGTIGCDFCGQAYIVRVQPAFPGMPQMPNGPGAPSDVGPDGGLVDPGMIGPDGMPVDGGPPPDEGDPDGDGPLGAPSGDDAPAGGDGKEDDSGDGPPPPPKSKKKSSRVYRGVHGQPLTEDQLARHIAVVVSGGDPRVLARLRAEASSARAARRVTAIFPEDLAHYRTLSTGHEVSVGRHGADAYGIITAPHPYSRQTHIMYLGRGEEDPREAAERHLATGPVRSFIHATTPDEPRDDRYQEVQGAPSGAWWNKPSQVRAPDPIFHSAARG
jgi:hypothetical protein